MSFLMRQVAHCDVCGHEWIVIAKKTPSHCASCKSRKWNSGDKGDTQSRLAGARVVGEDQPPQLKAERTVEYEE